jgi:hypothetical protein
MLTFNPNNRYTVEECLGILITILSLIIINLIKF